MAGTPLGFLLSPRPPSRAVGVLVTCVAVALCTLIIYPLEEVAPVVSLGVVYLPAVLAVSATWGIWFGVGASVLSAAAFNFFHLPPVGHFTIGDSRNWVALVTFLVVAVLTSSLADLSRARARDAEDRRSEADLAAEMARLLLRGERLDEALPAVGARVAQALELGGVAIEMDAVEGDERTVAFPLREGTRRLGTLLVGASTSEADLRRLQERVVPALEALLSAALEREDLLGDVVETSALRRADIIKTALLRAVSHDLRSPLTAISAAGSALASPGISDEERGEMAAVVQEEARRLSRLVDNLLDLSRLEAGAAEPRRALVSLEELIGAALADTGARSEEFTLAIDRDLPLVNIDAAQVERAFVNVFENARRHSGGHPVSIRARAVRTLADGGPARPGDRLIVRIVDRGPGIPPAQLERVFEPFYRAGTASGGHRGSGLGLAIARGFAEANGASLRVESLPGQGATFVFEFPLHVEGAGAEPAAQGGQALDGDTAPGEGAATPGDGGDRRAAAGRAQGDPAASGADGG